MSAEPNGMSYAELRDSLAAVAERTHVIGVDLVEVNPMLDVPTGLTSYLAAHTVDRVPREDLRSAVVERGEGEAMSDPVKVDVHMHLYESVRSGEWWKAGYEIFEYGDREGVEFSSYAGTVDDATRAMRQAGFAHGVAVNLLSIDLVPP